MSSPKSPLDELRIERRPERPSRFQPWLAVVVIAVLLVAGAGIWWHSQAGAVEVQTTVARAAGGGSGDERTVLNASGYVTARREATVSSKVTGKVMEVLIEEGMKVTNGQIVARLDDSNVKANLEVAQAQLASAVAAVEETRAQLKQANAEYERITELAKRNIESQSDLDQAESTAKTLQAHLAWQETQITVAERGVEMGQQDMDDLIIRAPFDGVITTKDAQPGEMISPVSAGGGFTRTGIGTVVDMTSLEIEIDVNESYINRVEPEPAGRSDAGRVSRLEDSLQGHRHHPDGRPRQIHRQGARWFRPAGPAHPAGHVGEGGFPRQWRAGDGPRGGGSQKLGAQPRRARRGVCRPGRPCRAAGGYRQ